MAIVDNFKYSPENEETLGDVALTRNERSPLVNSGWVTNNRAPVNKEITLRGGELQENGPPEITLRGVIIMLFLSIIFSCANAYLGLFAGMTISVSIPSAILSMAMLYPFGGNILEINAVQTGTASGSSIASGIIYTIPALVIFGFWDRIRYVETTAIACLGGVLGVMFSSPLRRALIIENPQLKFPEGVATAEILKVMQYAENRSSQVKLIGMGAFVGFLIKLGQAGLLFWGPDFQFESLIGGSYLFYFGINLSPALMSVGYIVGLSVASVMFFGGAINWWIVIPILYAIDGVSSGSSSSSGSGSAGFASVDIWDDKSRYLGVGAMLIGGIGTIIGLLSSLVAGVKSAFKAYKKMKHQGFESVHRTQRDLPIHIIGGSFIVIVPALFVLFIFLTNRHVPVAMVMTIFMTIFGFLFSAVGAYMSGVVGSSNNPVSGMTLATIITSCALMLLLVGKSDDNLGPAASILIGAVVCCAAAVSGDNMQDLKSGHLIGATPMKQQLMQLIGIVLPGLLIAPIVDLLITAYGLPNDPKHKQPLQAPQATLMASVAESIFHGDLPLAILGIGMGLAAIILALDILLYKLDVKYRFPVLAAALGMYLPFSLSGPIMLGGFVALSSDFVLSKVGVGASAKEGYMRNGLLFAAGLITGEALVGILLAIPIVITEDVTFMAIFGDCSSQQWPGLLALMVAAGTLFGVVVAKPIYEERKYYTYSSML